MAPVVQGLVTRGVPSGRRSAGPAIIAALLASIVVATFSFSVAGAAPSHAKAEATARAFLTALVSGNYAAAEKLEDTTTRESVPADVLAILWQSFQMRYGPFVSMGKATTKARPAETVVTIDTQFSTTLVQVGVTISPAGKVTGIYIANSKPNPTPTPASGAPTPSSSGGSGSPVPTDPEGIARAFLGAIAVGDGATAESLEDSAMRSAAPAAALGQAWQSLTSQFGAFTGLGSATVATQAPYTVVTVDASFEKADVFMAVPVSADGKVAGLHLANVSPHAAATPAASASASASPTEAPPAYVDPGAFTERDVTVGSAPWALPGILSMPNGPGPFPAVVLVAGSGPEDRDESIGPNKPLRDLAWGLASNGIAALRYDKRTLTYGPQVAADPGDLTVKVETMDDADAAVSLLRGTDGVDPARVFLIGHSLGGYLAPRIAAAIPDQLAGIGMLEANSTPLADLILTQSKYLASLQGTPSPETQAALEKLQAAVALADSPELSLSTPAGDLPFSVPPAYWLDLQTYDPVTAASSLTIPMFFSQGTRDYQVPPSERQPYRDALGSRSDVTFKDYPAMNHILIDGSGSPSPDEYTVPGHVDASLIADLVAWVHAN
jgi:uncharacterized protein